MWVLVVSDGDGFESKTDLSATEVEYADEALSSHAASRSTATSRPHGSASGSTSGTAGGNASLNEQWLSVRGRLQNEVGEVEYRSWLRQMTLVGLDGDEVTVHLPTRFLRDWVRNHYGDRLNTLWHAENYRVRRVDIGVGGSAAVGSGLTESLVPELLPAVQSVTASRARIDERISELAAPLDQRFDFDSFVVGKPNEFAHACARRVAERPASPGFNPLFLYGGVGLGKTHLMHAIAWELVGKPGMSTGVSVAYMSAEKFMYRFIAAIRSQSTMEFKEQLRGVDVLMIDDLQFLIGKDNTQEEFFHTFNAIVDAGRQIVVSAAAWWRICMPQPTSCAFPSSKPKRRGLTWRCRPR